MARRSLVVFSLLSLACSCGIGRSDEVAGRPIAEALESRASTETSVLILFPGTCAFMATCLSEHADRTEILEGMRGFVRSVSTIAPSAGQVGLIDYGWGSDNRLVAEVIAPLAPPKELENVRLKTLPEYEKVVSAPLQIGLLRAYKRLRDRGGRKIIVIVGGGQTLWDDFGRERVLEAILPFHRAGIELHAFAVLASKPDSHDQRDRLRNLADLDRYVEFESIGDGSAMAARLERILAERGEGHTEAPRRLE